MNRNKERGVALIMAIILVLLMSVMAVSLTFIARAETWSSMNYRLLSQARDAAEGGIDTTANYLMITYSLPGTVGDPLTGYNMNVTPVQSPSGNTSGHDVILSAISGTSSNYPISSVQSAFNANGAGKGSFSAGTTTLNYATSAKLLSMQTITPFGSPTAVTIPSWEITSAATVAGVQTAAEQVTAVLERNIVPTFTYAAFATDNGCSALQFGGGGHTDSYLSGGAMSGGHPVTANSSGNIGTNGNLATNGNPTVINGSLSTPRAGTGSCSAGNVTAWTASNGTVTGGLIELPQAVVYPTPTIPAPGTLDLASNGNCPALVGCTKSGNIITLDPSASGGTMALRDITMNANKDLHLKAGIYNINTLKQVGNTALILDTTPVIINVTGNGGGTVVDLSGGSVTNPSATFDPMSFQILYAGTDTISLKGGNNSVGLLYAPNATFSFAGNADWYGAVIGKNMTDMGGTGIHYDRRLRDNAYTAGPYMLSSFTWNKY